MAKSYLEIRDEAMAANTWLRASVIWTDYKDGAVAQQGAERSASGELLVSIGRPFRLWSGVFKVAQTIRVNNVLQSIKGTEWATREKIEEWSTSSNPQKRRLTMRTHLYSDSRPTEQVYEVIITGSSPASYGAAVPDGVNSFYLIPFEMQTRSYLSI